MEISLKISLGMASAGVADFSHFPGELEGMVGIWAMERGAWEVKDGKVGFLDADFASRRALLFGKADSGHSAHLTARMG